MASQTRDVFGTFEKRAPGCDASVERAFHLHFLARAWYCSNHPMRRSRPQEISIFEKVGRNVGDYVGKKLETLPFTVADPGGGSGGSGPPPPPFRLDLKKNNKKI